MITLMCSVNRRCSLTVPESITCTGTLSPPSEQEASLEEDALEKRLFLSYKGRWFEAFLSRRAGRHIPVGISLCVGRALAGNSIPAPHAKEGSKKQHWSRDHAIRNVTTSFFSLDCFYQGSLALLSMCHYTRGERGSNHVQHIKEGVFSPLWLFGVSVGVSASHAVGLPPSCWFGYQSTKAKCWHELRHAIGCCYRPANTAVLTGKIPEF